MLDDGAARRLTGLLGEWERDRDLACSVLLTCRGEVAFEGSYGPADRGDDRPVTPATRFGLASLTKMFTAVAIADLVAGGALRFEDRVADLLPAGLRPTTLREDVTVDHLLCHTSGIADYFEEEEGHPAAQEDYGALWRKLPSYSMRRPADFLPLFEDLPPYRAPGQRYQYSNAGYIILGIIIEVIAERPYTEVVEDRVLARAGMADSGFLRLDEAHPDVAIAYLPRPSPDLPWRSNIYSVPVVGGPDGGLFSTARDLNRFLTAYDDGGLLGPLHDVVLAPHADVGSGYHSGYGVLLYPDGRFGHGGGDPGVEVLIHRFPAEDVNLVVLCSMEGLVGEVRDAVLAAWRAIGTSDPGEG